MPVTNRKKDISAVDKQANKQTNKNKKYLPTFWSMVDSREKPSQSERLNFSLSEGQEEKPVVREA